MTIEIEPKTLTVDYFQRANIILTEKEIQLIEISTFGLPDYPKSGLQLLTYISKSRDELDIFTDPRINRLAGLK